MPVLIAQMERRENVVYFTPRGMDAISEMIGMSEMGKMDEMVG